MNISSSSSSDDGVFSTSMTPPHQAGSRFDAPENTLHLLREGELRDTGVRRRSKRLGRGIPNFSFRRWSSDIVAKASSSTHDKLSPLVTELKTETLIRDLFKDTPASVSHAKACRAIGWTAKGLSPTRFIKGQLKARGYIKNPKTAAANSRNRQAIRDLRKEIETEYQVYITHVRQQVEDYLVERGETLLRKVVSYMGTKEYFNSVCASRLALGMDGKAAAEITTTLIEETKERLWQQGYNRWVKLEINGSVDDGRQLLDSDIASYSFDAVVEGAPDDQEDRDAHMLLYSINGLSDADRRTSMKLRHWVVEYLPKLAGRPTLLMKAGDTQRFSKKIPELCHPEGGNLPLALSKAQWEGLHIKQLFDTLAGEEWRDHFVRQAKAALKAERKRMQALTT